MTADPIFQAYLRFLNESAITAGKKSSIQTAQFRLLGWRATWEINANHKRLGCLFVLRRLENCPCETAFLEGAIRIKFKSAMSFNEILEQLPKLTEEEKRKLWNILDQEFADEGEESPEFLAELDARIRALEHGARTYSLDEARKMVRDTVTRGRR
jgi:hypothetical protein